MMRSRRHALRALSSAAAAPSLLMMLAACASRRQQEPLLLPEPASRAGRLVELGEIASADARLAPRRVTVWLPPAYERERERRCRVLYTHDGQNLFDTSRAPGGVPWAIDEALAAMIGLGDAVPTIVVGVWNTAARWYEYAPEAPLRALPGDVRAAADAEPRLPGADLAGEAYVRFLADELKPQIDRRFRTLPGRADTLLMGASMGALASLYALCRRPEVFGGAACLSTHWPVTRIAGVQDNPGSPLMIALSAGVLGWFGEQLPRAGAHRLYFDHGTLGLDRLYAPYQARMDAIGAGKGYAVGRDWQSLAAPGAEHNEAAWHARLPQALGFLLRA
jgi:predicted alpha/beta superfamily hydrolase